MVPRFYVQRSQDVRIEYGTVQPQSIELVPFLWGSGVIEWIQSLFLRPRLLAAGTFNGLIEIEDKQYDSGRSGVFAAFSQNGEDTSSRLISSGASRIAFQNGIS